MIILPYIRRGRQGSLSTSRPSCYFKEMMRAAKPIITTKKLRKRLMIS